MIKTIKTTFAISFAMSFVITCMIMFWPSDNNNQHSKPHATSLEEMFMESDRSTRYELPSYYDSEGDVVFTLIADNAYGDMICKAIAFVGDNYGGSKYFTISGPYEKQYSDHTINVGPLPGNLGSTVVECAAL